MNKEIPDFIIIFFVNLWAILNKIVANMQHWIEMLFEVFHHLFQLFQENRKMNHIVFRQDSKFRDHYINHLRFYLFFFHSSQLHNLWWMLLMKFQLNYYYIHRNQEQAIFNFHLFLNRLQFANILNLVKFDFIGLVIMVDNHSLVLWHWKAFLNYIIHFSLRVLFEYHHI